MTLPAGTRLGAYEIVAPLGAGGMGEVYRARDAALGRDVAIKVLPAAVSADPDRLRRFEQEARSAGLLNHPNILSIYGFGEHEGAPYVVSELLEGSTLRDRMAGSALSPRRAIDYALQVAQGLAAAHEKGIVHRDLKPENLFVTDDGRVKILDFGLAKLTQPEGPPAGATTAPTMTGGTEPGVVLGTAGYMSPEQVRGLAADHRSDIFSFGAVLYEMLTGRRAFRGDSAIETMSAILKEDPPELSETNKNLPPALERIVRHCLEKSPQLRIQSARDLAYDLEALSGVSGTTVAPRLQPARSRRALAVGLTAAAALALVALGFLAARRTAGSTAAKSGIESVRYRRLTFRRGNVLFARFAPDGQTIVYSAAWDDKPSEIFLARIDGRESRPLGIPNAALLGVSKTGELAVALKKTNLFGTFGAGTLARLPMTGGSPRELVEDVWAADWNPEGTDLAILRRGEGGWRIEYPVGKKLYETTDDVQAIRFSPKGERIAFVEGSGPSALSVIDVVGGRKTSLVKGWLVVDSLAWHPSRDEIWFDGVDPSIRAGLYAADFAGKVRLLTPAPDIPIPHDISRAGDVLIERETTRNGILFRHEGDPQERDLSWLESSRLAWISNDGRTLLFSEDQEGGGEKGSVYLRRTDGSPAIRLGDGVAQSLSPDGKWALALERGPSRRLVLLPTGVGQPRPLDTGKLNVFGGAFLPDGRRILFAANEPGHGPRVYVMDVDGGHPRAFTEGGITEGAAISPDGKSVALCGPDRIAKIYPVDGSAARRISGVEPNDVPFQWSADGKSLYVTRRGELPARIERLDLATGKKELQKELMPADRSGLIRIQEVFITPDGKSYAYGATRVLSSDLYLASGLK
ncbi:MAG TPA: protein kinase [Thermoanaerobaculia bacterium]